MAYSPKRHWAPTLSLQSAKTSLRAKEKEVVNLVVSQVNECGILFGRPYSDWAN